MASEWGEDRGAKAGKPGNSYSALFGLLYVALASLELPYRPCWQVCKLIFPVLTSQFFRLTGTGYEAQRIE